MKITKGEIKEFLKSFDEIHKIEDVKLKASLYELCEIIDTYFLFGKPSTYVLVDWEVDESLRMKSLLNKDYLYGRDPGYYDLYPYFISFKRKKQLDLIL